MAQQAARGPGVGDQVLGRLAEEDLLQHMTHPISEAVGQHMSNGKNMKTHPKYGISTTRPSLIEIFIQNLGFGDSGR